MNKFLLALIFSLTLLSSCGKPSPSVQISDNWVRTTEDGQDVGAAYMTLTSNTDTTLTSVESSVSDSIEIHSMTMDNGVMKMRMLDELALKAGKPTELAPGGYHLMLFDLKKALKAGEEVSFTLHFKDAQGKETVVNVNSPIKAE
ncbi:MAG: copper chaperone PCu(A)C [Methylophilaceae bacterium]|nr:copper chaperone PCu(A)C [Methylophilaceae bacterium]